MHANHNNIQRPACLPVSIHYSAKKAQSQLIGAQNRHHTIFVTDHMCQSLCIVKSETENKTKQKRDLFGSPWTMK